MKKPGVWAVVFLVGLFGTLLGISVYKHLRYQSLTLVLKGNYQIRESNKKLPTRYDKAANTTQVTLHSAWWNNAPSYTLVQNHHTVLGDFLLYPTANGGIDMTSPPVNGNLAQASIITETLQGRPAQTLRADQWYQVGTNRPYVQLQFHWSKGP